MHSPETKTDQERDIEQTEPKESNMEDGMIPPMEEEKAIFEPEKVAKEEEPPITLEVGSLRKEANFELVDKLLSFLD